MAKLNRPDVLKGQLSANEKAIKYPNGDYPQEDIDPSDIPF